ncbi:MAG: hypothetical protein ACQETE_05640 [Bacteroidota bacterium]
MTSYYDPKDRPTGSEKQRMWDQIQAKISASSSSSSGTNIIRLDWKSFWLGNAAAILLILAGIGGYSVWNSWPVNSADQSLDDRLKQAYTVSLEDMQRISPTLRTQTDPQLPSDEALRIRLEGLQEIDAVIEEIRDDMIMHGKTAAKQRQLKRLYATKLDFVQAIIMNEEVEL